MAEGHDGEGSGITEGERVLYIEWNMKFLMVVGKKKESYTIDLVECLAILKNISKSESKRLFKQGAVTVYAVGEDYEKS